MLRKVWKILVWQFCLPALLSQGIAVAEESIASKEESLGRPAEGYRLLTRKAYLPPYFEEKDVLQIWRAWPQELAERAREADVLTRRRMIFERYGFTERVKYATQASDGTHAPLQFVGDENGRWSLNCFTCHGGTVRGASYPGAPNNRFAFDLFAKELRESKLRRFQGLSQFDVGAMIMPLGETRGVTNSVMLGVSFLHFRDEDLNVDRNKLPPVLKHHDVDAPPWWHFKKKSHIYIDGFAQKGHRGLMQFMMVDANSGPALKGWDDDFRHIAAYIESIQSPAYPYEIDLDLARQGAEVFQANCSDCHGTYKSVASPNVEEFYPSRSVEIEEIGTDPVRLTAFTPEAREKYHRNWIAHYGQESTVLDPKGYVAPPLDGIWATAPYFHNGSIPNLSQLLHLRDRPIAWRHRMQLDGEPDTNFDRENVGILYNAIEVSDKGRAKDAEVFDTREFGKSNAGHDFPNSLSESEKRSVLEYLKTL